MNETDYDQLLTAARALAAMLRDEYPSGLSVGAIAAEWGPPLGLSERRRPSGRRRIGATR